MKALRAHWDVADHMFSDFIPELKTLAEQLGIELTMPWPCAHHVSQLNVGSSVEEYIQYTIYVLYMDSFIIMESPLGESNIPYFYIFTLYPSKMLKPERGEFKLIICQWNVWH